MDATSFGVRFDPAWDEAAVRATLANFPSLAQGESSAAVVLAGTESHGIPLPGP